jgi:hypothetical protein
VPLTHWVVPTCWFASANGRQLLVGVLRALLIPSIARSRREKTNAGIRTMAEAPAKRILSFYCRSGRAAEGKESVNFRGRGPKKGTCSRGTAPACLSSSQRAQLFAEGLYRRCFVIFYIEDGIEFGDLKKIVNLLGEIEQLEFAALILCRGEGADEFADT